MLFKTSALLVAAASLVSAQTPPGFVPAVSQSLSIKYGTTAVTQAGQKFPQPDLGAAPEVALGQTAPSPKGIVFMIDLDVPRQGQRTTLLHWLATDVDISKSPVTAANTAGAPYLRPNPPAGDSAHRYVFLLFAQPDGFTIPAKYSKINPPATTGARVGFDLTAFAADTSLRAPLAANFITVQSGNRQADVSTTFPPAGGSTGSSSTNGTVVMSSLGTSSTGPAATGAAKNHGGQELAPLGLSFLAGLAAVMV